MMTINQAAFLGLFFLSVWIYYLIPGKIQWLFLLAASLFFYSLMGVKCFGYVLITAVTLTVGTNAMYSMEQRYRQARKVNAENRSRKEWEEKKAAVKKRKKFWLTGILAVNLGILLVLKYGDFFLDNLRPILHLAGVSAENRLGFAAPLGISYYTLQAIGYAVDVYKGKGVPEKNPLKVLLFVTFFPQMTQGPIGRFQELAPQLYETHRFSYRNLSFGCQRILWGWMKKAVIADQLKPTVTAIFSSYKEVSGFTLFMGCIWMTLQAYADFSGYTDIVCGISEVYGIHLRENFERPFFSKSLSEYWRRWHISLSSWFRDYIFYPACVSKRAVRLGKTAGKVFPPRIQKLFPAVYGLCFVWFCTGFWHDASWRYIFWGVANGVFIIGAIILEPQFRLLREKLSVKECSKWWKVFCMLRTFLLVALLKTFQVGESTGQSMEILKRILFSFRLKLSYKAVFYNLGKNQLIYVSLGLLLFFLVSVLEETRGPVREMLEKKPFLFRWCLYFLVLGMTICMGEFGNGTVGGFEYAHY